VKELLGHVVVVRREGPDGLETEISPGDSRILDWPDACRERDRAQAHADIDADLYGPVTCMVARVEVEHPGEVTT
jgi:hypothetical protein